MDNQSLPGACPSTDEQINIKKSPDCVAGRAFCYLGCGGGVDAAHHIEKCVEHTSQGIKPSTVFLCLQFSHVFFMTNSFAPHGAV